MERIVTKVEPNVIIKSKILNVAAYARVSVEKEAMHHSIGAQVTYYKKLIQENPEWNLVKIYYDEGITGTKDNRTAFNEMVENAKAGNIDLIITKTISRFARNTVTLLKTIRELKLLNVDVYFESENIHTFSKEGELLLTLLASYAQEESRSVSENMLWRVKKNFEEGLSWGTQLYGYSYQNNEYKVIPEEAKVVKRIYQLFLEGNGIGTIQKILNCENIKTRKNVAFSKSSIRLILKNDYYTGNKTLQKTYVIDHITKKSVVNHGEKQKYYVEDSHEAIISKEDFDKAQELFKKKLDSFNKIVFKPTITPFYKMIECGNCGAHLRRKTTPYKHIWLCNTFIEKGVECCNAKQISEEILMEKTNEVLGTSSFDEKLFKSKIKRIIACNENLLKFEFFNGKFQEVKWKHKSRSESWTKEKRELARLRGLEQAKRRKDNGESDSN